MVRDFKQAEDEPPGQLRRDVAHDRVHGVVQVHAAADEVLVRQLPALVAHVLGFPSRGALRLRARVRGQRARHLLPHRLQVGPQLLDLHRQPDGPAPAVLAARDLHGVEVLRHLRGLHEPGQLQHVRIEHCQELMVREPREPGQLDQVLVRRWHAGAPFYTIILLRRGNRKNKMPDAPRAPPRACSPSTSRRRGWTPRTAS